MEQRIFYFFAYDTITYILKKKQMRFKDSIDYEDYKNTPRRFQPCWGDAVLNYREFRRDFFFKLMEDYPGLIFENDIALCAYMKIAAPKVTRGESFCMDILRYFAFCADLAIHCHTSGSSELIVFLAEYMDFLKGGIERQAFRIVGGYHSLIYLAEQFVEYKNFKLKDYPPKESVQDIEVENIGFKPEAAVNQVEIERTLKNILESISSSITSIPKEKVRENTEKECVNVSSKKVCEKDPSENICENVTSENICETKPEGIQKLQKTRKNYSRTEKSNVASKISKNKFDLILPSTSSNTTSLERQSETKKTMKKVFRFGRAIVANRNDKPLQSEPKSVKKSYDEDINLSDKKSGPSPQKKVKRNA